MAKLKTCPACGATVSKQAPTCPQCGHRKKRFLDGCGTLLVVLIVLLLVVFFFGGFLFI